MTPDEKFVQAAIRRIYGWMFFFAAAPTAVLLVWQGWWYAAGFAAGAVLSILNFHWLKAGIDAVMNATAQGEAVSGDAPAPIDETGEADALDVIAAPAADEEAEVVSRGAGGLARDDADGQGTRGPGDPRPGKRRKPSQKGVVVRYVLRYALIVAAGYVIFLSSVVSLTAFLGGLFVFVAGVLAEMVFELVTGTGTTN